MVKIMLFNRLNGKCQLRRKVRRLTLAEWTKPIVGTAKLIWESQRKEIAMKKMNSKSFVAVVGVFLILGIALTASAETAKLPRAALLDKIRGAWVGKAYGVALGGPTEFRHMGTIIEEPLEMQDSGLERIANQDDLFVNMAFLQMVAEHGFDTPAAIFAEAFAYAGFGLGHANSQARQNILAGVPADMSGHPRYSPHAEDIDFQIEADFIGLCLRCGHV
jgi:hypothetical protein